MAMRRCFLIGFCVFVIFEVLVYLNEGTIKRLKMRALQGQTDLKEGFPVYCLIICRPHAEEVKKLTSKEGKLSNDAERQLSQTMNLLKSAAAFTKLSYLNFIIVVDEYWIFFEVMDRINDWPERYRQKLILVRREVYYPPERKEFRAQFRVCATERFFLAELLPEVDALIYLDTDVIFMRPPEELWNQFHLFDSRHLSGIAPYFYSSYDKKYHKTKLKHYGKSGLNVGVWMMNLTRIRNLEASWTNEILETFHSHKKGLRRVTQDIANFIFYKYPDLLYDVGCEWNYRVRICSRGKQLCKKVEEVGVHLMHGTGLSFSTNHDVKFRKFYEAWNEYEVGSPLTELLGLIRRRLAEVEENNLKSKCKEIDNIDQLITKGLENHIRSL